MIHIIFLFNIRNIFIFIFDSPRMVVLKVKIVQECKEPKVEMYKPIWGLEFKCNDSRIQFNLFQFSQEYSNQRNVRKKRSNKNTRCNGVRLKNVYVSGTLNLKQLRLSRNTKNSFTLVELGPLHKNGLSSLLVTRVTTHSKRWVTTHSKNKKWVTTHSRKIWALQLKKQITRRTRRIKLGEWRETRLSLNKNLANWVFLISWIISLTLYMANKLSGVMI
jgi:hypothetical protein